LTWAIISLNKLFHSSPHLNNLPSISLTHLNCYLAHTSAMPQARKHYAFQG
jgi:DTW domain-containing protein YfiP